MAPRGNDFNELLRNHVSARRGKPVTINEARKSYGFAPIEEREEMSWELPSSFMYGELTGHLTYKAPKSPGEVKRALLEAQAKELRKKLALLKRFGTELPYEHGAILAVDVRFPDSEKVYSYAAVVAVGKVYVTGCADRQEGPFYWHDFVTDFLARGKEVHVYFAQDAREIGGGA